ncbi:AraC-like DNA-binding protein [Curtobacterium luteum]|uniref:AraC-like DNA-binding protein n=1 Tax=Curtobacterium luteum TaxID=33881 RepID=A0ABS2RRX9_9MICO|nr:helix-turn-helix domain-containing protein [Curtobacterium luteum]MBM7801730.1 AraC-like DNA-binding protein [Curtobacterium luteum]NUU51951.1 helix-turn-helix domain-containing protein [Curtobacterium luteum]
MPSDSPRAEHLDRRGLDIDEAVSFYERVYASHDIHISGATRGEFAWRYRTVGDEHVSVNTSAVGARRWGTINPGRQYILAWATRPGILLDTDSSSPLEMVPGVPVMYPAHREFTFDATPNTQHLVRFDGDFLEAVAAAHRDGVPGPLVFRRHPDPEALRTLQRVISAAGPELLHVDTARSTRIRRNLALAEAVAAAFDASPRKRVVPPAGTARFRSAQEWIVANAHLPISVTDVSRASGLSVRGLQDAFQREVGITPMRFLRETRLHRVRAELLSADAAETTVAEVARAWGFSHLGRFAAYYEQVFAELPSATLRRPLAPR